MAKVAPFHSTEAEHRPVYHDDDRCEEGRRIPSRQRREGDGGRPKCSVCDRLDAGEQRSEQLGPATRAR
jgi:hypothetical protein